MRFNPEKHHRRSIRLKEFDYTQSSSYFVTLCTQNRDCLFGIVKGGSVDLNEAGAMVKDVWQEISKFYQGFEVGEFQIMPNHLHGILFKSWASENPDSLSLGDLIQRFKTLTTTKYVAGVKTGGWEPFAGRLWQRNYYEQIIRNEKEIVDISQYIISNPMKWELDADNPSNVSRAATGGRPYIGVRDER